MRDNSPIREQIEMIDHIENWGKELATKYQVHLVLPMNNKNNEKLAET